MATTMTTGHEQYSRINLLIVKGGTSLTQKLFLQRVKQLSPEGRELSVEEFLADNKTKVLRTRTGRKNKKKIYPPSRTTNVKDWDLHLVCFLLLEVCDLELSNQTDIKELQNMRNKLLHMSEPILNNALFVELLAKIKTIINRTCTLIDDTTFVEEINNIVESLENDPIALKEIVILNYQLNRRELRMCDILDHQDKVLESLTKIIDTQKNRKFKAVLEELGKLGRNLQTCKLVIPVQDVKIELTKCPEESDTILSECLAGRFTEKISGIFPEDFTGRITEAVNLTVGFFSQRGLHFVKVEPKRLLFRIKCDSLTSYIRLIQYLLDGSIVNQLDDILSVIRSVEGCENAVFTSVISEDKLLDTIADLVMTLKTRLPNEDMNSQAELIESEGDIQNTSTLNQPRDIEKQSNQSEKTISFNIDKSRSINKNAVTEEMANDQEVSKQETDNQNLQMAYDKLLEKYKISETDNDRLKADLQASCKANEELLETNKTEYYVK